MREIETAALFSIGQRAAQRDDRSYRSAHSGLVKSQQERSERLDAARRRRIAAELSGVRDTNARTTANVLLASAGVAATHVI